MHLAFVYMFSDVLIGMFFFMVTSLCFIHYIILLVSKNHWIFLSTKTTGIFYQQNQWNFLISKTTGKFIEQQNHWNFIGQQNHWDFIDQTTQGFYWSGKPLEKCWSAKPTKPLEIYWSDNPNILIRILLIRISNFSYDAVVDGWCQRSR